MVPSSDRSSVAIGPGNTWREVYTALENFNLTMVGGRAATVGVSGLLLGGRSTTLPSVGIILKVIF